MFSILNFEHLSPLTSKCARAMKTQDMIWFNIVLRFKGLTLTPPGTWSNLFFAGVRECPPWCSIARATVTVHQFFCILHRRTLTQVTQIQVYTNHFGGVFVLTLSRCFFDFSLYLIDTTYFSTCPTLTIFAFHKIRSNIKIHYINKRKRKCTFGCTIMTSIYSSEV